MFLVSLVYLFCFFADDSISALEILEAHIEAALVVKFAKAHLSQRKIVHIMRASVPPISVDATENFEHWTTVEINCVKVNCDATTSRDGVGWIFWKTIIIFLSL